MILALAVSFGVGLIIASAVTATCLERVPTCVRKFLLTSSKTCIAYKISYNFKELIKVEHCMKKKRKNALDEIVQGEIQAK